MGEREDVNALATAIGTEIKNRTVPLSAQGRLSPAGRTVSDWNNAVDNGWYNANNTAVNGPTADYYVGEVIVYDANWITQILYPLNGPLVWRRDRDAAVWGSWRLLNIPTLDRPGGFQVNGWRRAAYSFGQSGWSSTTTLDSGTQKLPIPLQVATKQWRVRISNKTQFNVTTGTQAVSCNGLYIGEAFKDLTTGEPTGWSGALTNALGAFTIPAAGGEYVSPWITAPAAQFSKPNTLYMLSMGWTKPAGSTIYSGSNGAWTTASAADVSATTPTTTFNQQTYFNIIVEYEFEGSQKVLLAIGDSLTESFGPKYAYGTWTQRLAQRIGMPVIGYGIGGATARDWASLALTDARWKRLTDGAFNIDASIALLGTNDCNEATPRTLAQYQKDMTDIAARLRNNLFIRDNYACTIPPRGLTAASTQENLRIAYNNWLTMGSSYYTGVFDINDKLEAAFNSNLLRDKYRSYQFGGTTGTANTDAVHWSDWGHNRAVDAVLIQ